MLELSHDIRKASTLLERNAEALRTATEALLATKREVHDGNAAHEAVLRGVHFEIKQMNTLLGVISKDVDDVERVTREATGTHTLVAKADTKEGLLRAFGEQPWYTQALVVATLMSAGGVGHWLLSLIGK